MTLSAQERAERSAAAMMAGDSASKGIGITLESVAPGTAVMSMMVEERHLNGHKICHGGFIFSLADSCFAFACNSYNQNAVAQHNSITYLMPGRLGDRLTATAREVILQGRSGIYDVSVSNENNEIIAQFRGHSRTVKGTNFDEDSQ